MKAKFSKQTILGIVIEVRRYGELYVATDGSMFRTADSADSTLRTKNMIIGEPDNYLGVVKLTKEMVSDARLAVFAKDTAEFDKLFEGAKIPRMREDKDAPTRKYATKQFTDPSEVSKLEALLGMSNEPKNDEPKNDEPKNDEPKNDEPKNEDRE